MSPVDRRALESDLFTAMEDMRAALRTRDTEAKRLAARMLHASLIRYCVSSFPNLKTMETAQEKAK